MKSKENLINEYISIYNTYYDLINKYLDIKWTEKINYLKPPDLVSKYKYIYIENYINTIKPKIISMINDVLIYGKQKNG